MQSYLIGWWLRHRRLTRLIIWLCRKTVVQGPGGSITVPCTDYRDFKTFKEVFFDHSYGMALEPESIHTIVDLGGNVGYSVAYFYINYPRADIYVAEPNPATYTLIVEMAKGKSRIHPEQVAISDHSGTVGLHLLGDATPSASLMTRAGETEIISVPARTFTEYVSNLSTIDLLKVDIEGSEQYVLTDPAMSKVRNVIAEVHPDLITMSEASLLEHLHEFAYTQKALPAGRSLLFGTKKENGK